MTPLPSGRNEEGVAPGTGVDAGDVARDGPGVRPAGAGNGDRRTGGPGGERGPGPYPEFRLTDEATGTTYVLVSGFVDLAPFAGQRVTITGAPIGGADFAPPALNVTQIKPDTAHNEPTGTEEPEVIYETYGDDWIYGEGGTTF